MKPDHPSLARTGSMARFRDMVLITAITCVGLIAATADAPGRNDMRFRRVDTSAGLPGDSVYCMVQDSSGYLWFGTFSGLARWDGNVMVSYRPIPGDPDSLPSSLIFDLHEDDKGTLWIATDGGGLARYSPDGEAFSRYTHNAVEPGSLASDRIFSVTDDGRGAVWLGTADAGVIRLNVDRGESRSYDTADGLSDAEVRVIHRTSDGTIWAGTGKGLYRYSIATDRFLEISGLTGKGIRSLLEVEGRLLAGTEADGLFSLDMSTAGSGPDRIYLGPDSDTLFIRALGRDQGGRIWAGTEDSGLVILYPDGRTEQVRADPGREDGLGHDAIRAIVTDRSGLVWIGTRGAGASSYNPRSETVSSWNDSISEPRGMVEATDGSVWAASDGGGLWHLKPDGSVLGHWSTADASPDGASRQDGRRGPGASGLVSHVQRHGNLPGNRIICLAFAPDGSLWGGTDGAGLFRLDTLDGSVTSFRPAAGNPGALAGSTVWALLFDHEGRLWIGLEGYGLDSLPADAVRAAGNSQTVSGIAFSHHRRQENLPASLPGNSVRCMLIDSTGRFWVGLWDGGLVLWNADAGTVIKHFRPDSSASSLADMSVTALYEDSHHRLWVGTGGSGINRVEGSGESLVFGHITEDDGLAGNDLEGFLEDKAGRMWAFSGRGLSLLDSPDGFVLSWTGADGFQDRFTRNAMLARRDGTFLIGGPMGIDRVYPGQLEHAAAPPVVISDVAIPSDPDLDQRTRAMKHRAMRKALSERQIVLRPQDAALVLDFAVLDYVDPAGNRLSVSLHGGPAGSVDLGSRSRAVLAGLAPGEYDLKVTGATAGGVWNRGGSVMRIVVVPPFWKTPAFVVLMSTLALATMGMLVALRTRSLQNRAEQLRILSIHMQDAREEERKTAAREVHDELGQLLTALKMELAWIAGHPPGTEDIPAKLGNPLGLVDEAIASVKSISTRLRPKALDTLSLSEALGWQLEEFRKRSKVECTADIEPAPEGLSESKATTLFRVFQELLTNVARHADARRVEVRFRTDDDLLILQVRDDGRGLPPEAATAPSSIGLLGLRERVRHEGGSVIIESPAPATDSDDATRGTLVRVTIPVHAPVRKRKGHAPGSDR